MSSGREVRDIIWPVYSGVQGLGNPPSRRGGNVDDSRIFLNLVCQGSVQYQGRYGVENKVRFSYDGAQFL